MMKKIGLLLLLMMASRLGFGQFVSQGKISFERKTNLRQSYQTDADAEWLKDNYDKIAQFTISNFTMVFNKDAASYKFDKEQEVASGWTMDWGGPKPAHQNKVFVDYKTGNEIVQRSVYEKSYVVESALPKYQWKIMNEMRTIAGYPCRKATTKICDSVVVVAFYCDEIMVSGGPESFNGLPGMILGIAIPRLYTTWFATSVELQPQEVVPFKQDKKTKKTTKENMIAEIKGDMKDWGAFGNKAGWWLTL
jgi:GLPGLI family protein